MSNRYKDYNIHWWLHEVAVGLGRSIPTAIVTALIVHFVK